MIIPIELRFKADRDSKSAFRTDKTIKSHDINTVEFHISIDGVELTDNHTAKILSLFHSSESQVNIDCEIVEGKIIYKPDTKLISRHEHVTNYVYVYHNNQSLDVREFIYTVDLSKIDETSLEVKEVYDQSYADLLADFEQALSDYKDNLPQADSVRADIDEILTQFSEDSQAKLSQYDADAQQVITDNQTAFDLAESVRQESYEQTQSLINEAELSRVQAEGQRDSAESSRISAETERVLAEDERENTEDSREQSEGERKANEEARELAEDERENAEEQREIDHANRSSELAGKADKVVIKNEIENGDFSDGLNNWLNFSDRLVVEVTQNGLLLTSNINGARIRQEVNSSETDIWYQSVKIKVNIGSAYLADDLYQKSSTITNSDVLGVVSYSGSYYREGSNLAYPSVVVTNGSEVEIAWMSFINLTKTFGAGNEPTKEEMDRLIEITGYIDGEYALNNKEMLGHLMKGIREKANKKQEDWITVPIYNGVQHGKSPLKVMKDNMGVVHFKGSLTNLMTGSKAFSVPIGYRPDIGVTESIIRIPVSLNTGQGFNTVQINYIGDGYINSPLAEQVAYFDGVSYVAKRG